MSGLHLPRGQGGSGKDETAGTIAHRRWAKQLGGGTHSTSSLGRPPGCCAEDGEDREDMGRPVPRESLPVQGGRVTAGISPSLQMRQTRLRGDLTSLGSCGAG